MKSDEFLMKIKQKNFVRNDKRSSLLTAYSLLTFIIRASYTFDLNKWFQNLGYQSREIHCSKQDETNATRDASDIKKNMAGR